MMMTNEIARHTGEIILYQPDETVRLERLRVGGLCPGMVRLEDDTVWLTQAQIAELFQNSRLFYACYPQVAELFQIRIQPSVLVESEKMDTQQAMYSCNYGNLDIYFPLKKT